MKPFRMQSDETLLGILRKFDPGILVEAAEAINAALHNGTVIVRESKADPSTIVVLHGGKDGRLKVDYCHDVSSAKEVLKSIMKADPKRKIIIIEAEASPNHATPAQLKKFLINPDGSVLIEMALVLPLFFFVIVVGIALMLVGIQKSELTRAVTIGAEYLGAPHTETDPCQTAATRIQDASPALNSSLLNVSVGLNGGSGSSCPGVKSGSGMSVTINATYPTVIPFFATGTMSDSSTVIQ